MYIPSLKSHFKLTERNYDLAYAWSFSQNETTFLV